MHFQLNLFSFLPDIHSFISFPLSSFCFQSLFSATMLPMLVPWITSQIWSLSSLSSALNLKSVHDSPSARLPPHLSPQAQGLLLPTHSHCSISWPPGFSPPPPASLLCCSQFHQPHPSPKSSQQHSAPCSFLLYLPLQSLSCFILSSNSPSGAHQSSSQASLYFPLPFSSTLSLTSFSTSPSVRQHKETEKINLTGQGTSLQASVWRRDWKTCSLHPKRDEKLRMLIF